MSGPASMVGSGRCTCRANTDRCRRPDRHSAVRSSTISLRRLSAVFRGSAKGGGERQRSQKRLRSDAVSRIVCSLGSLGLLSSVNARLFVLLIVPSIVCTSECSPAIHRSIRVRGWHRVVGGLRHTLLDRAEEDTPQPGLASIVTSVISERFLPCERRQHGQSLRRRLAALSVYAMEKSYAVVGVRRSRWSGSGLLFSFMSD
ncbi:hypothetical protein Pla108_26850 [Botrimarina colliarenosi]|uniref:Uncharacterized protein n=1 Tax=Botrimarina colliarenosi TaxID=2528001 RepID=A0A5C6ABE8_9BACT|nr:hypothetical protein Pla108_26850 [Botrimarina colliarenosi]